MPKSASKSGTAAPAANAAASHVLPTPTASTTATPLVPPAAARADGMAGEVQNPLASDLGVAAGADIGRVPMSAATAQRRISWNVASLVALYAVPTVFPSVLDRYYDVLEALVHVGGLPDGADEFLDAVLVWLRYALTIVFLFNIAEALLVRPPPHPTETRPTEVGAAFARSVSSGSPLTRPDGLPRKPMAGTRRVTPATPTHVPSPSPSLSPARSPSPRNVSPYGRAHASPYALGRGRPATPFSARAPSGSLRRTPSHKDVFAGRSVSRGSPAYPQSPRAPSEMDDAREVERALQQLR